MNPNPSTQRTTRWLAVALIASALSGSPGCRSETPQAAPAVSGTDAPPNAAPRIPTGTAPASDVLANTSEAVPRDATTPQGIVLSDVTAESGVDFVHWYDGHGELLIVEPVASGMASLDYDADGRIDLYFLNGASIPPDGNLANDGLYHNRGDFRFAPVSDMARIEDYLHSVGVGVADFDGDGFADILVNNYGPNRLYRNNGDGTFSDWTNVAGVAGGSRLGAAVCFFDADGDQLLDLYVGNYIKDAREKNVKRTTDGFASYPGPLDFEPDHDFFYRNNGDGTFDDWSQSSGIGLIASTSMGAIAGDFDRDGDTDLIVVNDVDRNLFYQNDGSGRFEEIGIQVGIAFSYDAQRNGNMGIDAADVNADGAIDLYTTTFSNDLPVLYRNDGYGNFEDVTQATGAGGGLLPHANWGTSFFDVENDGDKDLLIANGHTSPNVKRWAFNTDWKVANTLLINDGKGRFRDVSATSGTGLLPVESSRGMITDDLDNDGDVDIAILNALAPATLIRNDTAAQGNWLQLELVGRSAVRDAIGTQVRVEAAGKSWVDEVRSGRGYQSAYGQRLYFGLGNASSATIHITWSDHQSQTLADVATNQRLTIVQP